MPVPVSSSRLQSAVRHTHAPALFQMYLNVLENLPRWEPSTYNLLSISLTELAMKQKYQIDLINLYSF